MTCLPTYCSRLINRSAPFIRLGVCARTEPSFSLRSFSSSIKSRALDGRKLSAPVTGGVAFSRVVMNTTTNAATAAADATTPINAKIGIPRFSIVGLQGPVHLVYQPKLKKFGGKDGVIGRPACRSLEILGAALQADGGTGPHSRPQASEGEAQHGPFCRTRRISQGDQRLHCG